MWPHDTAIAVHGLVRAGFPDAGAAGPGRRRRLRRLRGPAAGAVRRAGSGYDDAPAPYPAACRPQAWSAAAGVLLLQAALGLSADVRAGRLRVDPAAARAFGPLHISGLRVAGAPLSVRLDADGSVTDVDAPTGWQVEVG